MRTVPLLLLLADGCYAQVTGSGTVASHDRPGGAVELALGDHAVRVLADLSVAQVPRPDGREGWAVLEDVGLRGSLVGAIARDPHGDAARWFDLGGEAGAGFGFSGADLLGRAWLGAYSDVRLWPRHADYPTLHVAVRRDVYAGAGADTMIFIGVGWTWRNPDFGFRSD